MAAPGYFLASKSVALVEEYSICLQEVGMVLSYGWESYGIAIFELLAVCSFSFALLS
jgi:hypothetical protein